ncbi:MAG: enoyl-CoA hydratase/isomerase family protein [Anaerolineae bacterium]|nr:enoyl-CoA hydratase/isomerase family protein [Anaerolineae bacterium]
MSTNNEDLARLKKAYALLSEMEARLQAAEQKSAGQVQEPVAIIGMACRLPGASDTPDQFWELLKQGRNAITEVPKERWDITPYYDPNPDSPDKTYCKWGGFVQDVDCFDPLFFNISPREAELMDPQQRLFLQECWHALEDAGYNPKRLSNSRCGVYAGVFSQEYAELLNGSNTGQTSGLELMGNHRAILAARISYFLNLKGPALSLDTACSSSLVAIHTACRAIQSGDVDMALAGGVALYANPRFFVLMSKMGMPSKDGQCFTFDARANGFAPAEGVGVLVLKSLAKAQADGDHIYAVIRGSGINQDGHSNGITAPNALSQAALENEVYDRAGIHPESISYVEAHGTGTSLGDPIEIEALTAAFREKTAKTGFCAIGSVKTNIGHTQAAAGVAGVIKVTLAFKHRMLPPSLNFEQPNPHLQFEDTPFYVNTALKAWSVEKGSRRAAISSFGFSGTNAHLVLEEYVDQRSGGRGQGSEAGQLYPIVLSAKNQERLRDYAEKLLDFVQRANFLEEAEAASHPLQPTLQEDLAAMVAEIIQVEPQVIEVELMLDEYGLDQVQLSQLREKVAERYSIAVSPDLFLETPSIIAIADYLTTNYRETLAQHYRVSAANGRSAGVDDRQSITLADLAYTLQVGREAMVSRVAFLVEDVAALRCKLRDFVAGKAVITYCYRGDTMDGEVSSESINYWLTTRNLEKLVEVWVKGREIDWSLLAGSTKPRRISLPTYPFAKTRYWFDSYQTNTNTATAEPLPQTGPVPSAKPAVRMPDVRVNQNETGDQVWLEVIDDSIALVSMQARQSKNMFSEALVQDLQKTFLTVQQNENLKVVILTGYDNVFCMGGTEDILLDIAEKRRSFTDLPFLYRGLLECDLPVIAAMQGHAFGGGLLFGLYADIVLMANEGVYSANFMKYGFTPGMGATYILGEKLGKNLATEMMFTARTFEGRQLKARGAAVIVSDQNEVLLEAKQIAQQLAQKPRQALAVLKKELSGRILQELLGYIDREITMHAQTFSTETVKQQIKGHFESIKLNGQSPHNRPVSNKVALKPVAPDNRQPVDDGQQPQKINFILRADKAVPEHQGQNIENGPQPRWEYRSIKETLKSILIKNLHLDMNAIHDEMSFKDMGLDSISSVEIIRDVNREFGLALDAVVIYDHYNLDKLSHFIETKLPKTSPTKISNRAGHQVEVMPVDGEAKAQEEQALSSLTSHTQPTQILEQQSSALSGKGNFDAPYLPKIGTPDTAFPAKEAGETPGKISLSAVANPIEHLPTKVAQPDTNDIAVIGLSGRFPGAENLEEFWENLANGVDSVTEIPAAKWDAEKYFDPRPQVVGKTYSRWIGALADVDQFDGAFFNISPREAEFMDPQQRLFLQESWKALEDAGYSPKVLSDRECGVFVGVRSGDYELAMTELTAQSLTGTACSYLAGRIAYFLNLSGPCVAIDTDCSSSLSALHLACQSLINGDCELALAGGVHIMTTPRLLIICSQMGILSPTGHCRTFDALADGWVMSEGVGVAVLKPLEKAIADKDHIYGVIKSSGFNQNGAGNGLTAPKASAQSQLQKKVYQKGAINPETIDYIEVQGTSHRFGDAIEVKALQDSFAAFTSKQNFCALGSLKPNIGHPVTASGIACFIKVLLSLHHKQLPPTIHLETINEDFKLAESPFYINTALKAWPRRGEHPRRAAVNGFGTSGTNCHLVIEEYQGVGIGDQGIEDGQPQLMVLSAKNEERLRAYAKKMLDFVEANPHVSLAEMAYSLQVGRVVLESRLAMVTQTTADLQHKLTSYLENSQSREDIYQGHLSAATERLTVLASEEGRDFVNALLRRGKLAELAQLWLTGMEIDWSLLYGSEPPGRISLPTYPFQQTRYWLNGGQVQDDSSDILPSFGQEETSMPSTPPGENSIGKSSILSELHALPANEQRERVEAYLQQRLAHILGLATSSPAADRPWTELGLDSLMGIDLVNRIGVDLKINVPLSKLLEQGNTVRAAAFILAELERVKGKPVIPAAPQPDDDIEEIVI